MRLERSVINSGLETRKNLFMSSNKQVLIIDGYGSNHEWVCSMEHKSPI
jgi:hypothetical protein